MTSDFEEKGASLRKREITLGPSLVAALGKRADQHKYDHGHAVVLSGGAGRTGAARLAARAALRIGAGLVTIAVPRDALAEVAAQVTAIMVRQADPTASILSDRRIGAVCLGPGFGIGPECRSMVAAVLGSDRATVLDADALTSFADAPDDLFAMTLDRRVVLTPHAGEFSRLFPNLECSVLGVARAAERAGCCVLLKGDRTMVGMPGGLVALHNSNGLRAAPWLATAGSGDVLAGMITGLLARGFDPGAAAEAGVWLHAECARHAGAGLIAEDLAEMIPVVFREAGV